MRIPKKIIKSNPSYAVVVDGETEIWYLQMLKRNERDIRVSIKPEIPNKKRINEQFNLVCELSEKEFTKVFWVVDFDVVIKEANESPKGKISPIKTFIKYRKDLIDKFPNVVVIVNNPCLEFWLLLHFEGNAKYYSNCLSVQKQLKIHLENYEKTERYYTKENDDIYLKLRPYLKTAIENSIALGRFNEDDPEKAKCEMELFFHSEALKEHFK